MFKSLTFQNGSVLSLEWEHCSCWIGYIIVMMMMIIICMYNLLFCYMRNLKVLLYYCVNINMHIITTHKLHDKLEVRLICQKYLLSSSLQFYCHHLTESSNQTSLRFVWTSSSLLHPHIFFRSSVQHLLLELSPEPCVFMVSHLQSFSSTIYASHCQNNLSKMQI